jgi:hypothetical protein
VSERQQVHVHIDRVVADRHALDRMGADGVAAAVGARVGAHLRDGPAGIAPAGALDRHVAAAVVERLRATRRGPAAP